MLGSTTGSYPTCNKVDDGETLSLETYLTSFLAMQFLVRCYWVLFKFQTLASMMGRPDCELGVVFGLKFQPYGLFM